MGFLGQQVFGVQQRINISYCIQSLQIWLIYGIREIILWISWCDQIRLRWSNLSLSPNQRTEQWTLYDRNTRYRPNQCTCPLISCACATLSKIISYMYCYLDCVTLENISETSKRENGSLRKWKQQVFDIREAMVVRCVFLSVCSHYWLEILRLNMDVPSLIRFRNFFTGAFGVQGR